MIDQLIDIIGREAACFESFLHLLTEQKRALVANDIDELNRLTHRQQQLLRESHDLNTQREQVIARIESDRHLSEDLTISRLIAMADSEQAGRLRQLRDLLLNLNDQILEVRNTNAMLINQSRDMIARTMAMLSRPEHP
ncbi:MAG: flagellar protein FlgN, partial [candidate division Zixibacteria bacterium]|nr:flagellar protein FlgN [candidate division Zixibacteria bacterium]